MLLCLLKNCLPGAVTQSDRQICYMKEVVMNTHIAFTGFPQAGLKFLSDLAAHNERTWFEAHKEEYQKTLLEPAQAFVMALGVKLQSLSNGIYYDTRTDGRGVLLRIHRDIRFSQDKTPYNTHLRGLFWEGKRKKNESPAFGFQIDATGMILMTGMFRFTPTMLGVYRDAVIDDRLGSELEDIVASMRHLETYEIGGEQYKCVPSGYDPNHPRADLLRYGGLYVFSPRIQVSNILTPALVDICYAHFERMSPLYHWLMKMMVG
jgi:uncharacterized protein (TIGR02453 family)